MTADRKLQGRWLVGAALLLAARTASAQEPKSEAPSLPEEPAPSRISQPEDRVQTLEDRINELNERLRRSEEERLKVPALTWKGYVDFGFFVPYGNRGAGWIQDVGNSYYPQYSGYSWTFLGDILSTPVNTRGEPADLANEAAPGLIPPRYDGINSDGAPGFILSEVNLRPTYALSESAILRSSINFAPRTGDNFALGDTVDVDVAELEYVLTRDGKTSFFAENDARVRHRIQGTEGGSALRDHAIADSPLHHRPAARAQDPQQAAGRLAHRGRIGDEQLLHDRGVSFPERD